MKEVFAKRLKNARKQKGYSQDDLVMAMNGFVKKTSIAKYERAEMLPDSSVVIALSRALEVLPEYFSREFNVEVQKPEFRKKSSLGIKELEAIQQRVMTALEAYIELEELSGKDLRFHRHLTDRLIADADDAEAAAETLLKQWNLSTKGIASVFSVLEDQGIRLIEVSENPRFDGFSTYANGEIPVIVYNKVFPVDRLRLTVLHELGHLLLNFTDTVMADEALVENLCFRFAAAMLLPRSTMIAELGPKRHRVALQEYILLKGRYGMSVHALVRRARDLGIITQSEYNSFHFMHRKNAKEIGWGNYGVNEKPERFEQLLIRSVAEKQISLEKGAELAGIKSIDFIEKYQLL